jgi:uncharacterized protein
MAKVLITGGTGLIGSYLSKRLLERGYEVALLGRTKKKGISLPTYTWDYVNNKIDVEAINTADFIIHLAGENIGEKRWTTKRRQQIIDSRVLSGELLFNSLIEQNKKLKTFITASAVGYYGTVTSDKIFVENDNHFSDFIGNTCNAWEQTADKFQLTGIRTVKLRTGIVLTKERGALAKMIGPLKFGIGPILGNGKQYLPWIHIDDLCGIYIKAIEDIEMKGAYNAVAPEHISYKLFMKQLAILSQKPFLIINIPSFLIKIMFGKMSEILLNGSRVSSSKLVNAGYEYKFPSIKNALADLLTKNTGK